ncbi:MAG: hypothetical protein KKH44_07770 [Bacteroidetes bacterium]|nr:hypothetical protein [Bacteroidota bacterium]
MKVTIESTRLQELEDAEAKLSALECGGVDNWEWYDQAMEQYNKKLKKRENIQELYEYIESAIAEGIEEPAGHGAGFGVRPEASLNALKILQDGIEQIITKWGKE